MAFSITLSIPEEPKSRPQINNMILIARNEQSTNILQCKMAEKLFWFTKLPNSFNIHNFLVFALNVLIKFLSDRPHKL